MTVDQAVDDAGLWLSLGDLAARKGVSKQAVSKNLKDWKARGVVVSTRTEGRALLVNVAEYDRARGEVGHVVRDQEPEEPAPSSPRGTGKDPVFAVEQAREKAYAADLKKLELGERTRKLVPIDAAIDEARTVVAPLVLILDRLPSRADDIATALAEDGTQGVRRVLKTIAMDLRNEMSAALAKLLASLTEAPRRPLADFHPIPGEPDPS